MQPISCVFRKCISKNRIFWKCIFWKYIFPKCIFLKCIFTKYIFPKCIFHKCISPRCVFSKCKPQKFISKVYFFKMYPTCMSSQLCEFLFCNNFLFVLSRLVSSPILLISEEGSCKNSVSIFLSFSNIFLSKLHFTQKFFLSKVHFLVWKCSWFLLFTHFGQ